MGMIHMAAILMHGNIDDERLTKFICYEIWFIFILFAAVFGFYLLGSNGWGIGLVAFVIIIGLCIIFWRRDNKKNSTKKIDDNY